MKRDRDPDQQLREGAERTLGLDDRPTVRDVIAIVRQLLREDRWHRRAARFLGRWWHMDWAAWRFRMRMRWHRVRNTDPSETLTREIDRVERILRDKPPGTRGKIYLPRGLFVVKVKVPDNIDIIWPRAKR